MASIHDLENLHLGKSTDVVDFDGIDETYLSLKRLLRQAERSVLIFSRDLDPRLYDDATISALVKDLVLASRHSQLKILVQNVSLVVKRGHRLVELARRLPSFIDIRMPAHEHASYNSTFVVADSVGFLYRSLADRYTGNICFNDRRRCNELTRLFNEMWEPATAPPDLRALYL